MAAFLNEGFPLHVAEFMAAHPPDPIGIWPCNLKTVALFSSLQDCWKLGPSGPAGLDLPSVKIVARSMGIKLGRRRLSALSTMASAALETMRARRG